MGVNCFHPARLILFRASRDHPPRQGKQLDAEPRADEAPDAFRRAQHHADRDRAEDQQIGRAEIGQRFAGRGLGTAAVAAMVAYAFDDLNLHRVEAACVPDNTASRRVLEKTGFRLEGQARAYLKINGAWADHLLFGVVNDGAGRGG